MYIHHFTRSIFENDPYGFREPISVEDAADSLENFRADYSDRELDDLDEGERQFVEDMNEIGGEMLAAELNYLFAEQLIEAASMYDIELSEEIDADSLSENPIIMKELYKKIEGRIR